MRYLVVVAILLICATANATLVTGFETPDYATGVLTGQNGWTMPSGTDYLVYSYAGNALGVSTNPYGGEQFIGGAAQASSVFPRAQHDEAFAGGGVWTLQYDMTALYRGVLPSAHNLGSSSLQPSASARFWQTLEQWNDLATATNWHSWYMVATAAGVMDAAPGRSPGAAWDNLNPNNWYRQWTTFDFTTNMVTEVGITDLMTGVTSVYNPTDWYLAGGATPTQPMPTALRLFAGGAEGNVMAWDNVSMVPEPGTMSLMALGLCGVLFKLRRK